MGFLSRGSFRIIHQGSVTYEFLGTKAPRDALIKLSACGFFDRVGQGPMGGSNIERFSDRT